MLNLIRKHADSWMIKSILWLIVFAFVGTIFYSWGMGGRSGGRSGVIATVNGEKILLNEYDQSFNNLINYYRSQFKGQFSQDLIEKLDLKNTALDGLIQKKILLAEAKKYNIQVSDQELTSKIKENPSFQKADSFDPSLYKNFLNFNRISAKEFEDSQREIMLLQKIEQVIKSNTKISESEMLEAFKKENEKIKFKYIQFPKKYFKPENPPSDEELKKYFEKNKTQFEVPEQIKVKYIKLTKETLKDEIKIHEEDIQDYYDAHEADYILKKRYRARHILIKALPVLPEGDATEEAKKKALDEAEQKAKKNAEDILQKIKDGKDFAELAKEHSEDPGSGPRGGDLGEFTKGTMVPEFEKALDNMKAGELAGPIKTVFGYHIIKLDELKEERKKPVSEVKEEITKKLESRKIQQRIRRKIKKIYQMASTDNDLEKAAKKFNSEVKSTDFISTTNHNVPDIGIVPEFFNAAFILKDNQISEPVNTPDASFLAKVVERKPPHIPEMDTVLEEVSKEYDDQISESNTKEKMKSLSKRLKAEKSLDKIASENKLEIDETPFFSMADTIPGIGNIKEIKDAVFNLKPGETTRGSSKHSHYLIQIVEREEAGEPTNEQKLETYSVLKKEKGNLIFKEWLDNAKEQSEILIDKTLL